MNTGGADPPSIAPVAAGAPPTSPDPGDPQPGKVENWLRRQNRRLLGVQALFAAVLAVGGFFLLQWQSSHGSASTRLDTGGGTTQTTVSVDDAKPVEDSVTTLNPDMPTRLEIDSIRPACLPASPGTNSRAAMSSAGSVATSNYSSVFLMPADCISPQGATTIELDDDVASITFSVDGTALYAGSVHGKLFRVDLSNPTKPKQIAIPRVRSAANQNAIVGLAVTGDGQVYAAAGQSLYRVSQNLSTGTELEAEEVFSIAGEAAIKEIAVAGTGDDRIIVALSDSGSVGTWVQKTGTTFQEPWKVGCRVAAIAATTENVYLAGTSTSDDTLGCFHVLNAKSGTPVAMAPNADVFRKPGEYATHISAATSETGDVVAVSVRVGSAGGNAGSARLRIWHSGSGAGTRPVIDDEEPGHVAISSDGGTVAWLTQRSLSVFDLKVS